MSIFSLYGVNSYRPPAGYNTTDNGDDTAPDQLIATSDELLKPGWPQQMSNYAVSSPIVADVDGNGTLEVIESSRDGFVYIWQYDGQLLSVFNLQSTDFMQTSPAAGDLNLDGKLELVSLNEMVGNKLYAWDYYGQILPNWPIQFAWSGGAPQEGVTLTDLNKDGQLEIIFTGGMSWSSEELLVFQSNGLSLAGFPVSMAPGYVSSASCPVADINNDSWEEIIAAGWPSLKVINYNGSILWSTTTASGPYAAPIIANMDNSGNPEIVVAEQARLYTLDYQGNILPGWPKAVAGDLIGINLVTGNFKDDSNLEFLHTMNSSTQVFAWNLDGTSVSGFVVDKGNDYGTMCTLGDLNNDLSPDVICGLGYPDLNIGCWDNNGNVLANFPLLTSNNVYAAPIITDLDGDGYVDVVGADFDGKVYVWDFGLADPSVPYNASATPWPMFQHDARHTGNYDADVTPPEITYSPILTADVDQPYSVTLTATDNVIVGRCRVFFKSGSTYTPGYIPENMTSTFQFVEMTNIGGNTWYGEVPREVFAPNGFEHYPVCWDTSVNPRINPLGAPDAAAPYIITPGQISDTQAPTITHTPVTSAPVYVNLEITAQIEDNSGEAPTAKLYYRVPGAGTWQVITMSAAGTTYSATIPGAQVTLDNLEYYIEAIDWKGNAATTPVYPITVYDDVFPVITHTPITEIDWGDDLNITADITDNVLISDAELCYRAAGGSSFACQPMTCTGGSTYEASVPAAAIPQEGGDYYLTAADSSGNTAAAPPGAPADYYTFTVDNVPDDDDDTVDDDSTPDDDTTPIDDDDDNDDDNDSIDDDTTPPVNHRPNEEDNACCGC